MMRSTWYVGTLCLALAGCATDLETSETFDSVRAVADCRDVRADNDVDSAGADEIDGLVRTRRLNPQDCADFAAMLETIRDAEEMLDRSLETRDYVQVEVAR